MSKTKEKKAPIGVFDSGLGGLTVVKALKKFLPHEDIVYFGDTARVPYGNKSKEAIIRFSRENAEILLRFKVKLIVVACNSSSSYALNALQRRYRVPVLGVIVPGAEKAAGLTRNKRVGVIATTATIKSGQYTRWIKHFAKGARVFGQSCPLFVPLAEEGWLKRKVTVAVAEEYLRHLRAHKVDTVILGCTHYPLLKNVIQGVLGRGVRLVDSATEVALQVKAKLEHEHLLRQRGKGKEKFLVSDKPQEFGKVARNFLGKSIKATKITNV